MLLRSDALTSFLLIGAATVLILWSIESRSRSGIAAAGICTLILLNLFVVGKRYLKADDFTTPRDFTRQFTARTVDKQILEDPDPSYRVLDLTVDVFNDSHPSYHHKNIGGYSPAKLQRYQDLIDRYLVTEINGLYKSMDGVQTIGELEERLPDQPVLSMLNLKYLILGPDNAPARYPYGNGPAWFVDTLVTTTSPDDEIAALGRWSPQRPLPMKMTASRCSPMRRTNCIIGIGQRTTGRSSLAKSGIRDGDFRSFRKQKVLSNRFFRYCGPTGSCARPSFPPARANSSSALSRKSMPSAKTSPAPVPSSSSSSPSSPPEAAYTTRSCLQIWTPFDIGFGPSIRPVFTLQ